MARHTKITTLSSAEIDRFMADITKLHDTICRPHISPQGAHYQALNALNEAIHKAVLEITGEEAPWLYRKHWVNRVG